jgi:hypothetical protein
MIGRACRRMVKEVHRKLLLEAEELLRISKMKSRNYIAI